VPKESEIAGGSRLEGALTQMELKKEWTLWGERGFRIVYLLTPKAGGRGKIML